MKTATITLLIVVVTGVSLLKETKGEIIFKLCLYSSVAALCFAFHRLELYLKKKRIKRIREANEWRRVGKTMAHKYYVEVEYEGEYLAAN